MINGEINLCFPKIGAPPIIQVIRQFCFNFSIETLKAHGFGVPPHLFGGDDHVLRSTVGLYPWASTVHRRKTPKVYHVDEAGACLSDELGDFLLP